MPVLVGRINFLQSEASGISEPRRFALGGGGELALFELLFASPPSQPASHHPYPPGVGAQGAPGAGKDRRLAGAWEDSYRNN